jgi:hypothetical protein
LCHGQPHLGDDYNHEVIGKRSLQQPACTDEHCPNGNANPDPIGVDHVRSGKAHHQEYEHVDHGEEVDIEEGRWVELPFVEDRRWPSHSRVGEPLDLNHHRDQHEHEQNDPAVRIDFGHVRCLCRGIDEVNSWSLHLWEGTLYE